MGHRQCKVRRRHGISDWIRAMPSRVCANCAQDEKEFTIILLGEIS